MFKALTIAGSDSCGGAGIQADIKTMTALGVYAMTAVTALTAQNTTGVKKIMEVGEDFLASQLDAVFEDIYPDAVKCGMIPNASLVHTVAQKLTEYPVKNLVVDPVMVSTSGHSLMEDEAITTLFKELLPKASVVTPNIPEAQVLWGGSIESKTQVEMAAKSLSEALGVGILIKGGHGVFDASDYLYSQGKGIWFEGQRIDNPNTHGTGCTLSSAIASYLAMGFELETAVKKAKDYLTGAIGAGLDLGKGSGPLNHMYAL